MKCWDPLNRPSEKQWQRLSISCCPYCAKQRTFSAIGERRRYRHSATTRVLSTMSMGTRTSWTLSKINQSTLKSCSRHRSHNGPLGQRTDSPVRLFLRGTISYMGTFAYLWGVLHGVKPPNFSCCFELFVFVLLRCLFFSLTPAPYRHARSSQPS